MRMDKIRVFLAITIPSRVREQIDHLQEELRFLKADVKWVRAESIHLTLKFLGTVSEEMLEKISWAIRPVIGLWEMMDLSIQGLGCFPSSRNPRVLWLGIDRGAGQISSLQKMIEIKAAEVSFPPETRPFTPHLTIGRVRSPKGKEALVRAIETRKNAAMGTFQVKEVFLIRSELTPSGAVYTQLKTFPMRADHV